MSMGSSSNTGEFTLTGRHACAACRHQRKRCEEDCVMAPYFAADKEEDFKAVHKIFGVSNMSKLLKQLDDQSHRGTAVQSFIWEAKMWKEDPVKGPLGHCRKLEREIELLRAELTELTQQKQQKEQESITLDQGQDGGALNYGYANQNGNLPIHGSTNGTYTSLLQGQYVTERRGSVLGDNCIPTSNYQQINWAKQDGEDQRRVIEVNCPIMQVESFHYPIIQGANGNHMHNNNSNRAIGPVQVQGGGRGIGGGIDCATNRGHVVFEHSVGQGQQRSLGSVGAHIGPNFGDNLPGHRRATTQRHDVRFSPYHQQHQHQHHQHHQHGHDQHEQQHHHHQHGHDQHEQQHHHPTHVQRQGRSQGQGHGQNHHTFQPYSLSNGQSYNHVQDVELFNQVKSERK